MGTGPVAAAQSAVHGARARQPPDRPTRACAGSQIDEFDTVYPACVAMFTEEVGVDPEVGSRNGYRARVAQLISQGWAFAIIEDGQVLFKTEVGAATRHACQLQGVYVHPDLRGQGIAAPAVAARRQLARQSRVVTLYVNDHNMRPPAYERSASTGRSPRSCSRA